MPLKSVTFQPAVKPVDNSLPALYASERQVVLVSSSGPLRGIRAVTVSCTDRNVMGTIYTYNDMEHLEASWTRCPAGTTVTLTQEAP